MLNLLTPILNKSNSKKLLSSEPIRARRLLLDNLY